MITNSLIRKLIEWSEVDETNGTMYLNYKALYKIGNYLGINLSVEDPYVLNTGEIQLKAVAKHNADPTGKEIYASYIAPTPEPTDSMKQAVAQKALMEALDTYYPKILESAMSLFQWAQIQNNSIQ